jgi:hypothetical protein
VTLEPHPLALRTPWYVLERATPLPVPVTDPVARRPAIQKYDTPDFVRQLIADPRRSLKFQPKEDVWSFPVPIGAFGSGKTGRARFATHRLVNTPMRKLYQPSHERFYAVVVELFCDQPGLPRPTDLAGVQLRFVLQRERTVIRGDSTAARTLARDLAVQLAAPRGSSDPEVPITDDVDDVLWVERTEGRTLTSTQAEQLASIDPIRVVEAWTVDAVGRSRWTEIDDDAPELAAGEREMPMWPLPPRADDCTAGQTRSLWFGMVPTLSGELDHTGAPMLDDRSIYRIRCFARQPPPPGHELCPPRLYFSDPTAAYRLASFYDPQGTKNRRVTITMPDFRTLAARAGEKQGPGGVEVVRPPGSQLMFDPDNGQAEPKRGPPPNREFDFGSDTSRCTFALELLMIVAMFLFSLFLPIVVFLFQLWWLLLLRFCFPRPLLTIQLLNTHLATAANTLGDLADGPTGSDPVDPERTLDKRMIDDDLFDAPGATKGILAADPDLTGVNGNALGKAFVADLDPSSNDATPIRTPEPVPDDPLCLPLDRASHVTSPETAELRVLRAMTAEGET